MTNKRRFSVLILVLAGVALDQITKILAITNLKNQEPFIIIKNVFQLRYLENNGAAFGLMQNARFFFLIIGILVLLMMYVIDQRLEHSKHYLPMRICGICIAIGTIGNMVDRVRFGYVVDFFYFELIDFPIFNVADIFVTCATLALAALILFYYKEQDFEQIFSSKRK